MTDKPAAMAGVYVDMKFMPGLKMARISIEIPIEHSNEFIRMFGTPDRVSPVAVGIARLQEGAYAPAVPERAEPAAPVVKAETKRSSLAHRMCLKPQFIVWVCAEYERQFGHEHYDCGSPTASADNALKCLLDIKSKTELDNDENAAAAWDGLLASYDYRNQVRA